MSSPEFVNRDHIRRELSAWETFTFLWRFTHGDRFIFFFDCTMVFIGGMLGAIAASRFGELIENLTRKGFHVERETLITLAALEMFSIVFIFIGRRALSFLALRAIFRLRQHMFDHMKRIPMGYYDREPAGRIVTRLTHDIDNLEMFYSGTLARLLSVFIMAGTVILVMFRNTWWLGLVSLLLTFPSVVLIWAYRIEAHGLYRVYSRTSSAITAKLAEFLNGFGVIRSFGLEEWSKRLYEKRISDFWVASDKVNFFNTWIRPATLALTHMPTIFLFSVGSLMVVYGRLTLGAFVAFIRLADRLARPAGTLMMEINLIQTAISSTERLTTFLEEPTEVLQLSGQLETKHQVGEVQFRSVSMKYAPELPWVFDDFDLHVRPGEKVGVMGRTGSGKSTLISLLTRLYPYQKGRILLGGLRIEDHPLTSLREQIGFVSQSAFLLPGSIRDNLTLGRPHDVAALDAVCETSGLSPLLKLTGRNLDSILLPQGANISLGEAQLISLTRILVQDPAIFVLDEATANLDFELENRVQRAIEQVSSGRTCIFIAHRLSTLTRCDRVIVLQQGKIVDEVPGSALISPSAALLHHLENPA